MSDSMALITRLNKQGYKYEFVATAFEIVNTNWDDKVSVILNNKYKIFLPNRFFKIISENLYEMNDNEWNTFYIYYRYEKKYDNGNVYHHMEFEADTLNTTVNNLLKQLNGEDFMYKYIKLYALIINEKYKITTFKKNNY